MSLDSSTNSAHLPTWSIPPREATLRELVNALHSTQAILVIGPRGVGKTSYSTSGAREYTDEQTTGTYIVASTLTPKTTSAALDALNEGDVFILDKPAKFPLNALDHLREAVEERAVRLIVETVSKAELPRELRTFALSVRRSTITVEPLNIEEFREHLVNYLGGPIPYQVADYFWRVTGGNQELAQIAVSAIRANGELFQGKYAWLWHGPFVAPAEVNHHVERQYEELSEQQQFFLTRLALVGSLPLAGVHELIDDPALEWLEAAGFVVREQRNDGVVVVQISSRLFSSVLERHSSPTARREAFAATPAPTRSREDARAIVQWGRLAMKLGEPLTSEQLVLINESIFSLIAWPMVEDFVDLKIPANATQQETVSHIVAQSYPEQAALIMLLLQRGLANYFSGLSERAWSDVRLARRILDLAPHELAASAVRITQLEGLLLRAENNPDKLEALYVREIDRELSRGNKGIAEVYAAKKRYVTNHALHLREPLDVLVSDINAHLGLEPLTVTLVPFTSLRLHHAGRIREALELVDKTLSLQEMRVTNISENLYAFSFAEIVNKGAFINLVTGRIEHADAIMKTPLAQNILDSPAAQTFYGHRAIIQGRWDEALSHLRGALQRYDLYDHNGTSRIAHALYVQALAATGKRADALGALADYERVPWGAAAVFEPELEYRILASKRALGLPELADLAEQFVAKFEPYGEWFCVLRGAHLGIPVSSGQQRQRLVEAVQRAATHVDSEIADVFLDDVAALLSGDEAHLSITRKRLAELCVWVPRAQVPLVLSKRQREIASLIVRGLMNREIAERLHLSVRTVESHVAAILAKVGAPDRRSLAAKLAAVL